MTIAKKVYVNMKMRKLSKAVEILVSSLFL